VTSEFFGGAKTGYPYRIKAYLNYYNDPAYTQPLNWTVTEALVDLKAMPLTFSIDAYMGETSQLCDYILPDTEYLERFGGFKTYPPVKTRVAGLRQRGSRQARSEPRIPWHPSDVQTADDTLIQLAIRCGCRASARTAAVGQGHLQLLAILEQYYQNGDYKGEPGLIRGAARETRRQVRESAKQYDGDYTRFPGGRQVPGYLTPQCGANKQHDRQVLRRLPQYRFIVDCTEKEIDPALWKVSVQLHTHKDAWHTQTRTMNNLWLASIKRRALRRSSGRCADTGVVGGDWVKVKSPSSKHIPFIETSMAEVGTRCRCALPAASDRGYSRSATPTGAGAPAKGVGGDGKPQYYDKRIAAGFSVNPLYMADPVLGDRILIDPVSGATQSYGTPLRVEKL
jgi:anaerobic selenocysteine-containing dehydrogenase